MSYHGKKKKTGVGGRVWLVTLEDSMKLANCAFDVPALLASWAEFLCLLPVKLH